MKFALLNISGVCNLMFKAVSSFSPNYSFTFSIENVSMACWLPVYCYAVDKMFRVVLDSCFWPNLKEPIPKLHNYSGPYILSVLHLY